MSAFAVTSIEQQYVTSIAGQYNLWNTNAYSLYTQKFNEWVQGGQNGPAPAAPQFTVLNTSIAYNLAMAWSNALGVKAGTNGPNPVLDFTSALITFQSQPQTVPAPPTPVVGDPVGAQSTPTTYLTVVGDASPNGAVFTDSRGTFVKTVINTPFGNEAYWTKVA